MVEQTFEAEKILDIPAATQQALVESELLARMTPGASVAVGVGSRGIANIPIIVKAAIDKLKEDGNLSQLSGAELLTIANNFFAGDTNEAEEDVEGLPTKWF